VDVNTAGWVAEPGRKMCKAIRLARISRAASGKVAVPRRLQKQKAPDRSGALANLS